MIGQPYCNTTIISCLERPVTDIWRYAKNTEPSYSIQPRPIKEIKLKSAQLVPWWGPRANPNTVASIFAFPFFFFSFWHGTIYVFFLVYRGGLRDGKRDEPFILLPQQRQRRTGTSRGPSSTIFILEEMPKIVQRPNKIAN